MKKLIPGTLFLLMMYSVSVYAQKGSLKVFSEIKGVQLYLDEVLQGTDITVLDSVSVGTHYLKAVKDNAIIYSDLITINPNAVTTVLIKNTKEVQDKLIESKYEEIQKYKNNRIDILLNSKYVTNTSGVTNSMYFPGYYVTTGTSYSSSQSVTQQETDWFVVRGGKVKITEAELAQLAEDQDAVRRIQSVQAQIDQKNAKINKRMNFGGIMLLSGTLATLTGLSDVLLADWLSDTIAASLFAGGLLAGVFGYAILTLNNPEQYPDHYFTIEEAVKLAETYNNKLKKNLGLPDNFQP